MTTSKNTPALRGLWLLATRASKDDFISGQTLELAENYGF